MLRPSRTARLHVDETKETEDNNKKKGAAVAINRKTDERERMREKGINETNKKETNQKGGNQTRKENKKKRIKKKEEKEKFAPELRPVITSIRFASYSAVRRSFIDIFSSSSSSFSSFVDSVLSSSAGFFLLAATLAPPFTEFSTAVGISLPLVVIDHVVDVDERLKWTVGGGRGGN